MDSRVFRVIVYTVSYIARLRVVLYMHVLSCHVHTGMLLESVSYCFVYVATFL